MAPESQGDVPTSTAVSTQSSQRSTVLVPVAPLILTVSIYDEKSVSVHDRSGDGLTFSARRVFNEMRSSMLSTLHRTYRLL